MTIASLTEYGGWDSNPPFRAAVFGPPPIPSLDTAAWPAKCRSFIRRLAGTRLADPEAIRRRSGGTADQAGRPAGSAGTARFASVGRHLDLDVPLLLEAPHRERDQEQLHRR